MISETLSKDILKLQKTVLDNSYNTMTLLLEQSERLAANMFSTTEGAGKATRDWNDFWLKSIRQYPDMGNFFPW